MAGYGNQRQADPNFDGHDTKFDKHTDTNSYQGGHSVYKSGTVGGAGFGNKGNAEPNMEEYDNSDLRFESNHTEPYSGGHPEMKSGVVGGAGFGNKTGAWGNDSRVGKVMEKVGGLVKNEGMIEKGREKREEKGFNKEGRGEGE